MFNSGSFGNVMSRQQRRCREAQALTAFLWFDTAVFGTMAIVDLVRWLRRKEGEGMAAGTRRGNVPGSGRTGGMTQV